MARSRSQTAPGEAVYLLHTDLRVPTVGDRHFRVIKAGEKATASDLDGLALEPLEESGFVEKVSEATYACEACQENGTAEEKKIIYKNLLALREHYSKDHPGLAAPTE